jgi:MoxR-like ATPase
MMRAEEGATAQAAPVEPALPMETVFAARREIHEVKVAPAIARYIVDLVNATRHPERYDADLKKWLQLGASPRGGLALERCARAHAWLQQRDFATPEDVRAVIHAALRHRLMLSYDATADGISADAAIDRLIATVALPA